MKPIYMLVIAVALCSCGNNKVNNEQKEVQIYDVLETPMEVIDAFKVHNPNATNICWKKVRGRYEACYRLKDGNDYTTIYNCDGSIYGTQEPIDIAMLPETVRAAALGMGAVSKACIIKMPDGGIQYEVEVGDKDYIYSELGTMVSEEDSIDSHDVKKKVS